MIEKALLVYRRRLDQKEKTKQNNALHKNTNSKMPKKKKREKKKRTVKELVSTKTVKGNRAVEKHKNGHKGLTFES